MLSLYLVFDILFHAELSKELDATLADALAKSEDVADADSPGRTNFS